MPGLRAAGVGRLDLVTANRNASTVSVLRNTSRPVISFSPVPGLTFADQPVGTAGGSQTVTINNPGRPSRRAGPRLR